MATVYVDVEVEVDMDKFSDEELTDEMRERGFCVTRGEVMNVQQVFMLARQTPALPEPIREFIFAAANRIN